MKLEYTIWLLGVSGTINLLSLQKILSDRYQGNFTIVAIRYTNTNNATVLEKILKSAVKKHMAQAVISATEIYTLPNQEVGITGVEVATICEKLNIPFISHWSPASQRSWEENILEVFERIRTTKGGIEPQRLAVAA